MKNKTSKAYKIIVALSSAGLTVGVVYLFVMAGNLNPSSAPGDTMHTLDDIYHRLDKDAGAPTSYGLDSPGTPAGTMHTLEDIYSITPDFRTNAGTAVVGDVCNSATFYTNSSTKLTGTRTDCSAGGGGGGFPDTGQTTSYTETFGEDHDYTSANSAATCDPSFTNNGDGTTSDNCTSLIWMTCSRGQTYGAGPACSGSATTVAWEGALTYCEGLNFAGQTDWRLPNTKELQSIVNYGVAYPAIFTAYFPSTVSDRYWSSTTAAFDTANAWDVDFGHGIVSYDDKTFLGGYYVRCVRQ